MAENSLAACIFVDTSNSYTSMVQIQLCSVVTPRTYEEGIASRYRYPQYHLIVRCNSWTVKKLSEP
jgi:hypothetical protein